MPTLIQAFDFVCDPHTTTDQLRLACEILGLDQSGERAEVFDRLDEYLRAYNAEEPIVCLNPGTSEHINHDA